MRVSVVINTYNRADCLRQTLLGLRYQIHDDFEVIVVNGPSIDDTDSVLREFSADVRVADCPEVHLGQSRNIGIAHAVGVVVAFIDDDAIPDPRWMAELVAGYDSEKIGGVGGIVYDHTGYDLQCAGVICDRRGNARLDKRPPFDAYQQPNAQWFASLMGCNSSFRRTCLEQIGGFDEEIEYYLDETDVCMRVIDQGWEIRWRNEAAVYHKFAPSHLRDTSTVLRNPFPIVKNKFYFALQARRENDSVSDVLDDCNRYAQTLLKDAKMNYVAGRLTKDEFRSFEEQIRRAIELGTERGLTSKRKSAAVPAAIPDDFRKFSTLNPPNCRLTLCLVAGSDEYESVDGSRDIGCPTRALAEQLATEGHEVRLIVQSPDHNRVDFENGVWVHRVQSSANQLKSSRRLPISLREQLCHAAAVHREILRMNHICEFNLVSAPITNLEGLFCLLDESATSAVMLDRSQKSSTGSRGRTQRESELLWILERRGMESARHVIPLEPRDIDNAAQSLKSLATTEPVRQRRSRAVEANESAAERRGIETAIEQALSSGTGMASLRIEFGTDDRFVSPLKAAANRIRGTSHRLRERLRSIPILGTAALAVKHRLIAPAIAPITGRKKAS